jgi:transcription initiation factor TFIID subunit 7
MGLNLPCPVDVELHNTKEHVMYYKSCDVAQMSIVYETRKALDQVGGGGNTGGFPGYHHSGFTPPLKRVVERLEEGLLDLMYQLTILALKKAKSAKEVVPEEVAEEIMDYETWMADANDQGLIAFDAEMMNSPRCIVRYGYRWNRLTNQGEIV